MNILKNFNFLSNVNASYLVKDSAITNLSNREKKIIAIILSAFVVLSACFALLTSKWPSIKSKFNKIDDVETNNSPKNSPKIDATSPKNDPIQSEDADQSKINGEEPIIDEDQPKSGKIATKVAVVSLVANDALGMDAAAVATNASPKNGEIDLNPSSTNTSSVKDASPVNDVLPAKDVSPIKDPLPVQSGEKDAQKVVKTNPVFPAVDKVFKKDLFVQVLNSGGYVLNGKNIVIPPAQKPIKYTRDGDKFFEEALDLFKKEHQIDDQRKTKFQFKDLSTEQAINESKNLRIALNFANEHHMGGGPGFHKDKKSGLFVYDLPSARAQEESLSQRSDLMASLTQLPHTLKGDSNKGNIRGSAFIRSYYDEEFDSTKMAYGSLNHLFALQAPKQDFYQSSYLEEPKEVLFVTSAAESYGHIKKLDCSKDSIAYVDAKLRIETHLLAAAFYSKEIFKQDESNYKPVELILGAFGCGAFAPQMNANEYRKMIAGIYLELLPKFDGIFDVVTFAVPTFGDKDPANPSVANHNIFKSVLKFK